MAVTLPSGTHTSGSVKLRDRVKDSDWPPAWSESDGPNRVVAWTYVELYRLLLQLWRYVYGAQP